MNNRKEDFIRMRIRYCVKSILLPISFAAVILSGCTVGPDYKRPELTMPQHWANPVPECRKTGSELARWWKIFEDQTLDWLIDKAIADSLDLKLAVARIAQARSANRQATAQFGPKLNASGSYKRHRDRTMVSALSNTGPPRAPAVEMMVDDQYQTGFDAGWEIDLFGGLRRSYESGKAELEASTEALRDVRVTLVAEVARCYIELRILQKRMAIADDHRQAREHYARLIQQKYENGLASGLDAANASRQAAETAAQIPLLEAAARQTIHKISILLGGYPGDLIQKLTPATELPMVLPAVPVGVPSELLRRRPDVRRAEAQLHAATARVGIAIADLYPKLTITGSVSYLTNALSSLFNSASQYWFFGPSIDWNLFDSGRTKANIRVHEALQAQAVITYQQKVLSAMLEVEDALVALAKQEAHRQALARAVRASRKSVQLAKQLYLAGENDFLHVLTAEQYLYHEEDAFAQSRGSMLIHLISLYKALGGGWNSLP
jgi:NodT family efflux transporter outer membrane factor (OMF) lipoprotein